ncbi:MAG: carbohydrate kinase [Candidatus Obscuribacterales bacterium]|nr:carbohydrate kinase [Candidatus Obscuribacterales bacterium]
MADVLCLGEILVDWVCTTQGAELDRAQSFTKAPGGAPANVAVGLARQGISTGFLGRVSTDAFGQWLKSILEEEGIDVSGTVVDPDSQTRMAYVVTTMTGDRKLAEFSKISVADSRFKPEDLNQSQFAAAKCLHFGSISLIGNPSAAATLKAIELAKQNQLIISYDPNVRIGLWPSPEVCKKAILDTLSTADLVKINLDELEFLTGSREFEAAEKLRQEHDIPLLIITLDSQGAFFTTAKGSKTVGGFQIQLVEATGAGDGFVSGILGKLLEQIGNGKNRRAVLNEISLEVLADTVRYANAIGALACTKPGAIPALPKKDEVKVFLEQMTAQASS